MATKLWAIALVLVCTFLTATAQILYKFGVNNLSLTLWGLLTNYYLITGLLLYGVGALVLVFSLKGGDLSVLYPIIATGYVWVSILSIRFLGEVMNFWKWGGIAAILLGVSFIGLGSRDGD